VPEELSRWFNRDDVMERLKYITIYPNQYTNVPSSDGCYQDKNGEWYYYTQLDERTSLTPHGRKLPEEECFKILKSSVMYKLQQIEAEERRLREKQESMSS